MGQAKQVRAMALVLVVLVASSVLPGAVLADEGVDYEFDCSLGAPLTVHGHAPATVERGGDLVVEDVYLEYTNPVSAVSYTGTRVRIPAPPGTTGPDHVIAIPGEVELDSGETYRSPATTAAFRVVGRAGTAVELRPSDLVIDSASTVGGSRLACTFPAGQAPFARSTVTPPPSDRLANDVAPFPSFETFVEQQHRDVLGRVPTQSQHDRWVRRLDEGMAPTEVVRRLLAAPRSSAVVPPLVRLHLVGLGRRPEGPELAERVVQVRAGLGLGAVADQVALTGTGLSERAYVTTTFRRATGRAPDRATRTAWVDALRSGALSRGGLLLALAESAEHRARSRRVVAVTVAYSALLRRVPSAGELDRAADGDDLVGSVLASAEYRARVARRCDLGSPRYCARRAGPGQATVLSTLTPDPLVLDPEPPGTVIDRAFSEPSPIGHRPWLHTLYAEPDRDDPIAGRALVVGTAFEDSPVPYEGTDGFRQVVTEDGRTIGVGTERAWTWATWSDSGCECIAYVAGRQLSEDEVLTAARSVRGRPGQRRPRIAPDARPVGLQPLVSGPVQPELVSILDRQRLSYRIGTPRRTIELAFTESDPRLDWLQRFWVDGGRAAVPLGGEAPFAAVRYVDGLSSAATAPPGVGVTTADLEELLDTVRPARGGEWRALQRRARDEADLLEVCSFGTPQVALLSGRVGSTRWGVTFDEEGNQCTVLLVPGRQFDSLSQSGGTDNEPGLSLFVGIYSGGGPNGTLLTGDAPPGTATLRVEARGRVPLEAELADRGNRPGERWYAAFIGRTDVLPVTVVALAADGTELARTTTLP